MTLIYDGLISPGTALFKRDVSMYHQPPYTNGLELAIFEINKKNSLEAG